MVFGLSVVVLVLAACAPAAPAPAGAPAKPADQAAKPSAEQAAKPAAEQTAKPAFSPGLAKLIEGAKQEGVLRGSWGATTYGGAAGLDEFVAGMNKRYGLDLKAQFTPGVDMQAMLQKVAQEAAGGQPASTDVYLGNSQAIFDATKVNALKPVDWPSILERTAAPQPGLEPVAPGGIATIIGTRVVGLTYNSDLLKGADVPRKLEDILNPKWKGKIAGTPYASGLREMAADDMLGLAFTTDYTQKLSKQIAGLIRCGEGDRLTSGEFLMLAFDCGANDAINYQRRGAPIAQSMMQEFSVLHMMYGGVPVNSRSPNAAALFISFFHSPEGQAIYWKHDATDLHLYPESNSRKQVEQVQAAGGKLAINTPQRLASLGNAAQVQAQLVKILQEGGK
jgi:iron(III) transport system substrate-binding protein